VLEARLRLCGCVQARTRVLKGERRGREAFDSPLGGRRRAHLDGGCFMKQVEEIASDVRECAPPPPPPPPPPPHHTQPAYVRARRGATAASSQPAASSHETRERPAPAAARGAPGIVFMIAFHRANGVPPPSPVVVGRIRSGRKLRPTAGRPGRPVGTRGTKGCLVGWLVGWLAVDSLDFVISDPLVRSPAFFPPRFDDD